MKKRIGICVISIFILLSYCVGCSSTNDKVYVLKDEYTYAFTEDEQKAISIYMTLYVKAYTEAKNENNILLLAKYKDEMQEVQDGVSEIYIDSDDDMDICRLPENRASRAILTGQSGT